MIQSYLAAAIRRMARDRAYTAVTVLGLAAGIACALLVSLYVRYELSFDAHHANADRVYRVMRESTRHTRADETHRTSEPLGEAILAEVPGVEDVAKWRWCWSSIRCDSIVARAEFVIANQSLFQVFDFRLDGGGDPLDRLREPARVLITRSARDRIFGDRDPVGSTISARGERWEGDFVIAGVLEDPPRTSVLNPDFIATQMPATRLRSLWDEWVRGTFRRTQHFLLLREDADPSQVERLLQPLIGKHLGDELARTEAYRLQRLRDIRLDSAHWLTGERNITQVYLFGTAGALLLVIACINYVSLSTALASRRAREVGLRKVSGAPRRQLVVQFLGESCLLSLLAGSLGAFAAYLALPDFSDLVGEQLVLSPDVVGPLVGLVLFVGLAAGAYPALYMSSFKPTRALKTGGSDRGYVGVRRGLVVLQFAASITLVIVMVTVSRQLGYVAGRDLGYDSAHIINLPIFGQNPALKQNAASVEAEILRHAQVLSSTVTGWPSLLRPARLTATYGGREYAFNMSGAEPDVWDVFGFEIVEGRSFRDGADEYVINETASGVLGENVIGEQIVLGDGRWPGTIVGIFRDYHYESLHRPVGPLCIRPLFEPGVLSLKVAPTRLGETMDHLKATWKKLVPDSPFQSWFADRHVDLRYRADRRVAAVSRIAATISISIACLGLLALATFAAERRAREIGIRKVLGASVSSLLNLLSAEFLWLLLVANLIAWPLGYWGANEFLASFAYRIDLGLDVFLMSTFGSLLLAIATVSLHTVRAAVADPVAVLKED